MSEGGTDYDRPLDRLAGVVLAAAVLGVPSPPSGPFGAPRGGRAVWGRVRDRVAADARFGDPASVGAATSASRRSLRSAPVENDRV